MVRSAVFAFALLAVPGLAVADVRLPSVISNNMVLQQRAPITVWGWANSGESVRVELGRQVRKVVADDLGGWQVVFDPMRGSNDVVRFSVQGSNRIELQDVKIGEVWVASGQSNMEWTINQSGDRAKFVAEATDPDIRMFNVERKGADAPQVDCKGVWQNASPASVGQFSAVGYHFARNLKARLQVPVGILNSSYGGTPAESWTPESSLMTVPSLTELLAKRTAANLGPSQRSTYLWNAMVAPISKYRIKGAIWYQGESNVGRAEQYSSLFPTMIRSWRKEWGQGDFPFLFVQLAPFRYGNPTARNAAALRESQLQTLSKVRNTGMAVVSDIATVTDIHPPNKHDVGHRLALWALARTYGKRLDYSGPMPKAARMRGTSVEVQFNHGAGLATRDGLAPSEFEIAGEDGLFRIASAVIAKDRILASCPEIDRPVWIRYGWRDDSEPNLTNRARLPAPSFQLKVQNSNG